MRSRAKPRPPPELCWIAVKAMSKAREDRYQHGGGMVVDVRRVKTALTPEQSSMMLHSAEAVEASSRTVTLAPGWLPAAKLKWPAPALLAGLPAVLMMVLFSMRRQEHPSGAGCRLDSLVRRRAGSAPGISAISPLTAVGSVIYYWSEFQIQRGEP
ncbi:MAG: hypothetical protein C0504_03085 [Candidatus Solibacter sp.]|nr:hypothetical protein [Candidatus Solibacter sp.]